MNGPPSLSEYQCLGLGSRALHQLRASLEREGGIQAASTLQEAGVAGGEGLFSAFAGWLQTAYGVMQPGDLDATYLPDALRGFFSDFGWGNIAISDLSPAVMALDSEDWAEASPDQGSQYPSCHFTSGLLADFLGRLGQGSVAVMEVECRTRGDARCRFLVGAPESLSSLYDRMARGLGYVEALGKQADAS